VRGRRRAQLIVPGLVQRRILFFRSVSTHPERDDATRRVGRPRQRRRELPPKRPGGPTPLWCRARPLGTPRRAEAGRFRAGPFRLSPPSRIHRHHLYSTDRTHGRARPAPRGASQVANDAVIHLRRWLGLVFHPESETTRIVIRHSSPRRVRRGRPSPTVGRSLARGPPRRVRLARGASHTAPPLIYPSLVFLCACQSSSWNSSRVSTVRRCHLHDHPPRRRPRSGRRRGCHGSAAICVASSPSSHPESPPASFYLYLGGGGKPSLLYPARRTAGGGARPRHRGGVAAATTATRPVVGCTSRLLGAHA